ncbi:MULTISPECIES: hypothetical protein [Burkholderia]|uniref:Uncharacterized protein n=1 Tax=Burkholderia pseudomallei TaxID=28450 RepID=A0AA40JJ24_BURPE|nr:MULTISPECIES: hypothetical protein [Burkholderia]KGS77555.1 hypothetical protein X942_4635 [Burkholderia pseudomallei MSHR5596]KGX17124.1 hypothetical protein Y036_6020 [Burkholderia pseudomallei]VWD45629.1 hypothetical protein BCO18175_07228 [Burkholderia contaminans]
MNTIEDLRTHLFETLTALRDKDHPMEIERAQAIAEVAQVVINSAKVEVEHVKIVGGKGTGFIKEGNLPLGVTGTTQHRLR